MARRRTVLVRVDEELAKLLKELAEQKGLEITITSKELARELKKLLKSDEFDFRI